MRVDAQGGMGSATCAWFGKQAQLDAPLDTCCVSWKGAALPAADVQRTNARTFTHPSL